MAHMTYDEIARQVGRVSAGLSAGAARVHDGTGEVRFDSEGVPYLLAVLRLDPPPTGHETWAVDDLYQLREQVRRRLSEAGVELPVSLSMTSTEPEPSEEDGVAHEALADALDERPRRVDG